jgi:multidrug resistance efflux pump
MTDANAAPSPDAAEALRHPPRISPGTLAIAVTAAVAAVLVILFVWRLPPFATTLQVTENAYVRGQVTVMSPQVSGYVTEVAVQDFQHVRQGQVLARIDERIYRARVEQARAALAAREADLSNIDQAQRSRTAALSGREAERASAEAQASRARSDLARINDLASDGSVSLRERDQAVATLRQTEAAVRQTAAGGEIARQDIRSVVVSRDGLKAAVEAARAALRLAQIDLDNTIIRAPRDGQLGEVSVRLGQFVVAGTQLMALVPARLWVTANYKEAQTAHMAIGQPVTFTVDALGKRKLRGVVEDLAPATGSEFSVLRPENATGNFVKVAQRIPVKIAISANQPLVARLRPGMSVVTKVDTKGDR